LALIPKKVRAPLLANMLTGGKTPNLPAADLAQMGYKIVVYPIESLLMMMGAVDRLARTVLQDGSIDALRSELAGFSDVKKVLGLEKFLGER
jgi:2-methylisocitrate lyase-like PEP mutase family enzyme